MDSNDIFRSVITAHDALRAIEEDAKAFYWLERHEEDHSLLHRVFLLSDFCTVLQEPFQPTSDDEIEIPDDLDLDLISGVIPVVAQIYGNLTQGEYVRRCVGAVRPIQGQTISRTDLLNVLPLLNATP